MARRTFLAQLAGLPLALKAAFKSEKEDEAKKRLKILMKGARGPDDPTRAAFPFSHGLVLAEAGHEVQIFLLAEATGLMRKATATAILPVGCRRSPRRWKNWSPNTFPFLLEGPAAGPVGSRKTIWQTGTQNSAIPPSLFRWSSGPIASSWNERSSESRNEGWNEWRNEWWSKAPS